MPAFAVEHDLRIGVTSALLEGSKRVDDWRQMLQVFPNPDQPIEPKSDMFARMGQLTLGPLEIKLLTQINGEMTPRALVATLGLPLHDVYQMLLRLAREGVLSAPGGDLALASCALSVEESLAEAFAALDANDDAAAKQSALDKVLGGGDEPQDAEGMLDKVLGGGKTGLLDKVFGGDIAKPAPRSGNPADRGMLSMLKKRDNRLSWLAAPPAQLQPARSAIDRHGQQDHRPQIGAGLVDLQPLPVAVELVAASPPAPTQPSTTPMRTFTSNWKNA